MIRNKKLQVWLPMIFSVVLIGGMYFGFKLRETTPNSSGFFKTDKKTSVQEIMDLVKLKYVDSVKTDSLQYDAIQEMINHLDPHSVYIPASQLQEVNEDIMGNFDGIGIEFNIFSDTINILYVLPGGPSDNAGLEVGDKILSIDSNKVAGKNIDGETVRKMVRGESGSTVTLTVLRENQEKKASIVRGRIPVPAIDAAYMVNDSIGYIKLNKFSESSYREFMQSLESLQQQGLKKLIFDLRGNRGGLLNQAVDMVDEFLDDNKLIVYTEGTNSKRREYNCKRPGLFETGELIILIDELSASASEVVAGALQDWDRATILGRRSFGKGLVQEQYPLSDGSALRLTIARYYTPVGRSIQRPYENGKKEYIDEIWERYTTGEMVSADSNKIANGKIYRTVVKKRPVYGGGGIMPDEFISIDTSKIAPVTSRFLYNSDFNSFVYHYYIDNRGMIDQFSSINDFQKRFNKSNQVWKDIVAYAAQDTNDISKASAHDKETILNRFTANLARYKWRNTGLYEVLNNNDPVFIKAVNDLTKK
ncbi:MAG: PDZ domain-containing protein [Terrimonas sp.]|nr:PDZ domain-containing protein [Terrimonas sp.]